MKLTAETVTKDNVIEYLEGKDIDNIGLNEYKEEIVFDDFTDSMFMHCTSLTTVPELPATTFTKNYENLINKNKDKDEKKEIKNFIKYFLFQIFVLYLHC